MAASWIGALLGVVAMALSISGLFGVLTYTLAHRSKEIGIRIALGATSGAVVRMVMGQTVRLAGWGALAGLVGALVLLQCSEPPCASRRCRSSTACRSLPVSPRSLPPPRSPRISRRAVRRLDPAQTLRADA